MPMRGSTGSTRRGAARAGRRRGLDRRRHGQGRDHAARRAADRRARSPSTCRRSRSTRCASPATSSPAWSRKRAPPRSTAPKPSRWITPRLPPCRTSRPRGSILGPGRSGARRPTSSRIKPSRPATSRRRSPEPTRIVEARFAQHRQTHAPLEPRGCIAEWDAGRRHLTFRSGNQAPHPLRTALAPRLRLKETQVTVISPDVGGGFGQKIVLLREELCGRGARRLRSSGRCAGRRSAAKTLSPRCTRAKRRSSRAPR